jgi:hypothetical protein
MQELDKAISIALAKILFLLFVLLHGACKTCSEGKSPTK